MRRPGTITYPKNVGPWDLEPHYSHHVGAMTSEDLHAKADIAFQLALRDKEIDLLRAQLLAATRQPEPVSTQALAVPVHECGDGTCGLCWKCPKQGNEPQGARLCTRCGIRPVSGAERGFTMCEWCGI